MKTLQRLYGYRTNQRETVISHLAANEQNFVPPPSKVPRQREWSW